MLLHENNGMVLRSRLLEVFCKKVFLEISQKSQKNTCVRVSFLIKLQATLLKERHWYRCFPVNFAKFCQFCFSVKFAKFLRAPILKKVCEQMLPRGGPVM